MKIQDFITYCESNQIAYEIHGAATNLKYDWENWSDSYRTLHWSLLTFGFEFKRDVWYWFDWMSEDMEDDYSFFLQRYNRNNGAMQKTFHKGYECTKAIQNYLQNLKK